jgi:hypothetical protein
LGGAKLGGPWGQPLHAPSVPSSAARPPLGEGKPVPGEFTQMFHKLELAPAPPVRPAPEARPEISRQEPGEFTRMFVRATASMPQRPMPAASDPAAFAPPAAPRLKGFSTPGVSDSASPDGSFTQLFQTPARAPAAPVRPFTPLSNGTEAAWSSNLDSAPSKDGMESAGVTQLFRALSPENEPPANRFGEHSAQPGAASSSAPESMPVGLSRRVFRSRGNLPASCRAARGVPPPRRAVPRGKWLCLPRLSFPFPSLLYRRPRLSQHLRPLRSRFPSFRHLRYQRLRLWRVRIRPRASSSR